MIKPFPKIFAIGTPYVAEIFDDDVEITEKVDGSQFVFGVIDGELKMRSKGAEIFVEAPQKMFEAGVQYAAQLFHEQRLEDGTAYYCEYLQKPKHNVLAYSAIPRNHLSLFGVSNTGSEGPGARTFVCYEGLQDIADELAIDVVPMVYRGTVDSAEMLLDLIDSESFLGGPKMEGVVVKNYARKFLSTGNQPCSLMAGKYVSEKFKEVHKANWKGDHTGKGKWDLFKSRFRSEARWEKAVQHLRDAGTLEQSPRDIGGLIKEVRRDIGEECEVEIKDFLFREFGDELLRGAIKGLPEWYKEKLLVDSMHPGME